MVKRNSEKKEILKQIALLNKKLNVVNSEEGRIEKVERKIEKEERILKIKKIRWSRFCSKLVS